MSNELKNKILEHDGISVEPSKMHKSSVSTCPRCDFVNTLENRYCSKCSYPLSVEAFDQIKQDEENKIKALEASQNEHINRLREDMENKIQQILLKIDIEKTH